jgi:DNA-binding transcriptional LysR family regulator
VRPPNHNVYLDFDMKQPHLFDKIDIQLIRTLHTLLTERSVSKTAMRLGQQQPAVSVALKRLRELTGDPILVRSGTGMVPTDVGLQMLAPVTHILQTAERLFSPARGFKPADARETFRIAASDTLDPLFLPLVMARIKSLAPGCRVEVHALSAQAQAVRLTVGLDTGSGLLMWLQSVDDQGRVMGPLSSAWLQADAMPSKWHGFRCAVYSRPKTNALKNDLGFDRH